MNLEKEIYRFIYESKDHIATIKDIAFYMDYANDDKILNECICNLSSAGLIKLTNPKNSLVTYMTVYTGDSQELINHRRMMQEDTTEDVPIKIIYVPVQCPQYPTAYDPVYPWEIITWGYNTKVM